MGGPSKKKKQDRLANDELNPTSSATSSNMRKIATVIVSIILIISLGLPVAGLGFASCSSCSIPIYD